MIEPQTNREIEVGELLSMIDSGQPLLLLDVRNEEEHQSWPLEGLRPVETFHLPYFEFIEDPEASMAKLPRRAGPIAVLCQGWILGIGGGDAARNRKNGPKHWRRDGRIRRVFVRAPTGP